jgi:methylthioribose-1-phosphate isomerase
MNVRGAPLIGLVAAAGIAFATREDSSDAALGACCRSCCSRVVRPPSISRWALAGPAGGDSRPSRRPCVQRSAAEEVLELQRSESACCARIGEHGLRSMRVNLADRPA